MNHPKTDSDIEEQDQDSVDTTHASGGAPDPDGDPDDGDDPESGDADEGDDSDGDGPALVDESQFVGDDDDDDDDDVPMHFGAVAPDEQEQAEREQPPPEPTEPPEIPLHLIDPDALWVVRRLHAKGFEAYLTGGCVRDLLLARTPKDFDVATAGHPNQVKSAFRNCRLVGRRFRLAHVFFPSGKVIETATFRANPIDELEDLPGDLLVERDNVFGNVEQDARRRDLTINGLFYDPLKGKVLDFVDGRKDLEARLIRTIGDPEVRFQEDPVRILRAIKFATRLGFDIEERTFAAMKAHVGGLVRCAPARLQEEMLRLLTSGHAKEALRLCDEVGVMRVVLPELEEALEMKLEPRSVVFHRVAPPAAAPVDVDAAPSATADAPAAASSSEERPLSDPDAKPFGDATEPSLSSSSLSSSSSSSEGAPEPAAPAAIVEPEPPPAPPTPEERFARRTALLESLDAARARDLDVSASLALAVLLTPVWEAFRDSTTSFDAWFEDSSQKWTERIRLTRHDKERMPQVFGGQDDLVPRNRRGHAARQIVHRPSFRESLLLFTLRLHAKGAPLDEVALWKVLAQASGAPYKQPKLSERASRMRAARQDRGGGGGGGGRRGRGDRSRRGRRR